MSYKVWLDKKFIFKEEIGDKCFWMNASSVAKHNYINLKVLIQTNQDQQWKRINGKKYLEKENFLLDNSSIHCFWIRKSVFLEVFLLFPTQTPNENQNCQSTNCKLSD